ncbi:rod-binding protein [Sulfitobacter sp. HNIBRBA3233]|uniref:rod-binding protein n=1 Tax=Sulfitobacter marinivivus TaxID=3158558 RepID=UPI0032DEC03F
MIPPLSNTQPAQGLGPDRDKALMDAAKELEVTFLAEMLESAGLGEPSETFGGGAGEDQFGSLLIQHQARFIVDGGGIGLAQTLFETLKERAK